MSKLKYQSYLVTFVEKSEPKTLCITVPANQPLETYKYYTTVKAISPSQVREYLDSLPIEKEVENEDL